MTVRTLRLPPDYKAAQMALQAWIEDVSKAINGLPGLGSVTFRLTWGVSPTPFPFQTAGTLLGAWVMRCVDTAAPQTPIDVTGFSWTRTSNGGAVWAIDGLTTGRVYDITLGTVT